MDSSAEDVPRSISRRGAIKGSTAIWLVPSVVSFGAVATAMGSGIEPTIIATTNFDVLDPPPPSIKRNQLASNTDGFIFQESGCVALGTDVIVNRASDGTFAGDISESATIPAGTLAASFLVVFDRTARGRVVASVTFSNDILGLAYLPAEFAASTSEFALTGLCYPTDDGEYFEGSDTLVLSGNTLEIDSFVNATFNDVVRVIVAC